MFVGVSTPAPDSLGSVVVRTSVWEIVLFNLAAGEFSRVVFARLLVAQVGVASVKAMMPSNSIPELVFLWLYMPGYW